MQLFADDELIAKVDWGNVKMRKCRADSQKTFRTCYGTKWQIVHVMAL